jgi:hypothetical protein
MKPLNEVIGPHCFLLALLLLSACSRHHTPSAVSKNEIDVIAFRRICERAIGSEVPGKQHFLHSGKGGDNFYTGLVSTQNTSNEANIEKIARKLAADCFVIIADGSNTNNTNFYEKYSACVSSESSSDLQVFFSVLLDSEDRVVVAYTIF